MATSSTPNYIPSPNPVRLDPFSYDKDGLKLNGTPRSSIRQLKALFRKNTKRKATKAWITTQLNLYGFDVKVKESAAAVTKKLEDFVKGKNNTPLPNMQELEKSLSKQYEEDSRVYTEQVNRQRDATFAQLGSPTEEAKYDTDRFLAKYFLDGINGKPSPEKTKKPLILERISQAHQGSISPNIPGLAVHSSLWATVVGWKGDDFETAMDEAFAGLATSVDPSDVLARELNFDIHRFLAKYFLDGLNGKPDPLKTPEPIEVTSLLQEESFDLEVAIDTIPGLVFYSPDDSLSWTRSMIIGWGREKVETRKREIQAEEARIEAEREAAEMAEKDEDWKFSLPPHHAYLENYQPPSGSLDLDRLVGKYIVRCDKLDDYATSTKAMSIEASTKTMHIHPRSERSASGLVAAFDFDMIAGTMLLGNSDDAVHQLSQDMYDSSDGDWSECYDSDLDGDLSDTKKRKAKNESVSRPIKRRLGEATRPNRVYLLWGGRETGEGEIQVDTANGQSGYLDFDEQTATAQGQFSYPSFFGAEEPVGFSIYKVSDHPSERPEAWARLSEKQWDYECTARWR